MFEKPCDSKLGKKLTKIIPNRPVASPLVQVNSNSRFCNLMDIDIPDNVVEVLSLGHKFDCKTLLNKENIIKTIRSIESFFGRYNYKNINFDEDDVNMIRHNVINGWQLHNDDKNKAHKTRMSRGN